MKTRDDRPGADPLDGALQALRAVEVPEALARRALANLDAPERARPRPRRPPQRAAWLTAVLYLTPVAATAAGAAVLLARPSPLASTAREFTHAREIALELPHAGDAVAELALTTHHHTDTAHVRVEVPSGVALHLDSDGRPSACAQSSCVHHWRTGAPPHRNPLQVVVSEPGRYVIHVTHVSPTARVHERFIVLARRRAVPAA